MDTFSEKVVFWRGIVPVLKKLEKSEKLVALKDKIKNILLQLKDKRQTLAQVRAMKRKTATNCNMIKGLSHWQNRGNPG